MNISPETSDSLVASKTGATIVKVTNVRKDDCQPTAPCTPHEECQPQSDGSDDCSPET